MPTIVVIEDEPDIAVLVTTKFRNAGYDVRLATNGEDGIELVKTARPDVVLLDVMMPGKDGYEVCQAIRSYFGAASPIVILLSARSQALDRQRGFAAGCDEYVTKPFRPADLLARVTNLIDGQRL